MRLIFYSFLLLTTCNVLITNGQTTVSRQYKDDFNFFWKTIHDNYCYFDKKATDWDKVRVIYSPRADTVSSRNSFVQLLEEVLNEIYDHHASLNTNTAESQRLVPSGTDIWAEYVGGKPLINELRKGFGVEGIGLRVGMEIVAYNDLPIETAVNRLLPKALKKFDIEAKNVALRQVLAGKHSESRKIKVKYQGREIEFSPDQPKNLLESFLYNGNIESGKLKDNIGYIRINNRLWDNNLIREFDSVLNGLMTSKAMILDLRETPSGGNTTVVRAIIGRFITREGFYQKHEYCAEQNETGIKRSWTEIVSPRPPTYTKPLIILVNHWTGSVAEGMAIGFDALKRARIIGIKMAQLNGANYSFTLPNTGIGFSFPAEKLFHINGTPREDFIPKIVVGGREASRDFILEAAINYLK
jgi:C-terminal processing protease CtpA/Prc